MHRADVDDSAVLCLIHVLEARLCRQEGTVKVDCEHPLPFEERELVDRPHDLDTGIADKNVNSTKALHSSCNAGVDGRLVAYVHLDAHRDAAGSIDLIRGRLRSRQMQVRDHHRCALDGETLGDLLAYAARSPGYDGMLPAKLWHGATPYRSKLGFACSSWCNPTSEIIVDYFAQSERQISDQVCSSDHYADWQLR